MTHGPFAQQEWLAFKGLFYWSYQALFTRHKAVGCYEAEVKSNNYTRKYQIKA